MSRYSANDPTHERVGNHDQEPIGEPDGTTDFYNQYCGVSHFTGRTYYGGHFGSKADLLDCP